MSIFNRATPPTVPTRPVEWFQARRACADLGVDLNPDHVDALTVADFVRLAHQHGVAAAERRLMSPDTADVIAFAIDNPEKVVPEPDYIGPATAQLRWQVAAVQQAAVYGVPR